jgi:hypothetical protein
LTQSGHGERTWHLAIFAGLRAIVLQASLVFAGLYYFLVEDSQTD